jgi:hypothetical protein
MEPEALNERIRRLERSNRRLVATAALFAIGTFALVGTGAGRNGARTIDVERIFLRDPGGKLQAELRACKGESGIALFDPDEHERLRLRCSEDGSTNLSLTTGGSLGVERKIELRAGSDGWSSLSFTDAEGERLTLGLAYDGEPRLRMYTPDQRARVSLGSDLSGRAEFVIHDAGGAERGVMRAAPDGSTTLKLYDGEGRPIFCAPRP